MRFTIGHSITYRYGKTVFLEPLIVRLRPRCDATQRLDSFALQVTPLPAGTTECIDFDGTSTTFLWFEDVHPVLTIEASSQVETFRTNPFDYLVHPPEALQLPMRYDSVSESQLQPYIIGKHPHRDVDSLGERLKAECSGNTLGFLDRLVQYIAGEFEKPIRRDGDPFEPHVTLAQRSGACRDLTLLFMEVCRSLGLAARFVGGYAAGGEHGVKRELHAWAEVYLPGAGWRGYDPSAGIAVADRHVAVAAGATATSAAPTSGTYRGTGAVSELSYEISISVDEGMRAIDLGRRQQQSQTMAPLSAPHDGMHGPGGSTQ